MSEPSLALCKSMDGSLVEDDDIAGPGFEEDSVFSGGEALSNNMLDSRL